MVEVWFIRHAESTSNAGLPTENPGSILITDLGRQQALDLAEMMTAEPAMIITSPYIRTYLTAEPTINKFPNAPVETWDVQEYTYLSPEKYRGTTVQERGPMRDFFWSSATIDTIDGPGAESFSAMMGRVRDMIKKLQTIDHGPIYVFSHGMFMQAFRISIENPAWDDATIMKNILAIHTARHVDNTEIYKTDITKNGVVFKDTPKPPHIKKEPKP